MATAAELLVVLKMKDELGPALKAVSGQVDDFATSTGKASSAIAGIGTAAVVGGIAAVGAGLGLAVKSAADFEKTMSGVKAVSGSSAEDMAKLSGIALQLGKDTSFSATEAGKGIEELVKAGVSLGDVMGGAAAASLNLAAAGEVSVTEAATIASNAMNAFGIKGSEMAHVADTIAGAANASALDVHDFGYSLAASGAVAATVGFSFDDLATAIAVMGQAGIKGSDAGTSLKTMMLNLQPTTDKQVSLFKELGLITEEGGNAFFDASGKVKSMAQVAGTLQTALAGMTEQQRLAALEVIFGSDAIRAGAVLAKAGAEGFNEMAASMGKVTAESVAAERLNNLNGSLEKMKGSLATAAIAIGTAFLPVLRQMVDAFTTMINDNMPAIEAFAATLSQAFTDAIPYIVAFFQALIDNKETIGIVIAALGGFIILVTVVSWIAALVAALAFLISPIGLIVVAVALLAAAWATNWGDIRGKTAAVITWIQTLPATLAAVWAAISAGWTGLVTTVTTAWNAIVLAITTKIAAIVLAITTFFVNLGVMWAAGWALIDLAVQTAWTVITTFLTAAMAVVYNIFLIALGLWYTLFVERYAGFVALTQEVWTAIYTWFTDNFWNPLVDFISTTLTTIQNVLKTAWETISSVATTLWSALSTWFMDTFWRPLVAFVTTTLETLGRLIATAWQAIQRVTTEIWGAISKWFTDTFWNPLVALTTTSTAKVSEVTTGAWNAIKTKTEEIWNAIKSFLEGLWNGLKSSAGAAAQDLKTNVLTPIKDLAKEVGKAGGQMLSDFLKGMKEQGEKIIKYVGDLVKKISEKLSKAGKEDSPSKMMFEHGANFGAGFLNGLQSTIGSIENTVTSMAGVVGSAFTGSSGPGGAQRYNSAFGRPMTDNIADYVAQAAAMRGMDPTVAQIVAMSEGGLSEPARRGTFSTGSSWWPFQLHYGGSGYEYLGNIAGMGNSFTAMTGWAPGDPAAWKDSVDYALDVARKSGWGQWYGAAAAGIGNFQGIPRAYGGSVYPGNAYLVGEHGPEMFSPRRNGFINPQSGGQAPIIINVNAPIYGVNDMEDVVVSALDRAQRRGRAAA